MCDKEDEIFRCVDRCFSRWTVPLCHRMARFLRTLGLRAFDTQQVGPRGHLQAAPSLPRSEAFENDTSASTAGPPVRAGTNIIYTFSALAN